MKIIINSIGKERFPELQTLIDEYLKRIPWDIKIIEHIVKPQATDIPSIKRLESNILLANTPKSCTIIALDEQGKAFSSVQFARLIQTLQVQGTPSIAFLIGGANGHSQELKGASDMLLSLSPLTFAHKLVRLILAEQLYRAYSIINNHPYHR